MAFALSTPEGYQDLAATDSAAIAVYCPASAQYHSGC